MQPLKKRIVQLVSQIDHGLTALNFDAKQAEVSELTNQLNQPEIWNNPEYAQGIARRQASIQAVISPWQTLSTQARDILELIELGDDSLQDEFEGQISAMEAEFKRRRKELLFNGRYDTHNAIIRLSAGVGGTDAQDFTEMLERMYLRWAEKNDFKATIIERSSSDEAGIKSSVININGSYIYGRLKSDNGVHRLVRLSPFNSDNLRQTSFSLVEVLPEIDTPEDVNIDDKDLKIDVYRSGGKGGQSVNTTDSAVRITHIPTGIVIAIQNERSQLQNRETAMKLLRSKLAQLQLEQHADTISDLQAGESANWGSQIRNYVLHPYTMVKDTRTKYELHDAASVFDGDIDDFSDAYLHWVERSNDSSIK